MDNKANEINILELFEQNKKYETCNIEFEPWGSSHVTVDFHPVVEIQEQLSALRRFINSEWVDTDIICKALGMEFFTGLRMFDFSRTARWCEPPLNGQIVTTKFRLKKENKVVENIPETCDTSMVEQVKKLSEIIDEYTDPLSARDIHRADFSDKFAEHLILKGCRMDEGGQK